MALGIIKRKETVYQSYNIVKKENVPKSVGVICLEIALTMRNPRNIALTGWSERKKASVIVLALVFS